MSPENIKKLNELRDDVMNAIMDDAKPAAMRTMLREVYKTLYDVVGGVK